MSNEKDLLPLDSIAEDLQHTAKTAATHIIILRQDKKSLQTTSKQLQAEIDNLIAEVKRLKARRISNSCVECAYLGGDCCGVLYSTVDGRVLCNECGREFDINLKDQT